MHLNLATCLAMATLRLDYTLFGKVKIHLAKSNLLLILPTHHVPLRKSDGIYSGFLQPTLTVACVAELDWSYSSAILILLFLNSLTLTVTQPALSTNN